MLVTIPFKCENVVKVPLLDSLNQSVSENLKKVLDKKWEDLENMLCKSLIQFGNISLTLGFAVVDGTYPFRNWKSPYCTLLVLDFFTSQVL